MPCDSLRSDITLCKKACLDKSMSPQYDLNLKELLYELQILLACCLNVACILPVVGLERMLC